MITAGSRVRVTLFGSPRIDRDGLQARVDTRKAIALLAFLVACDGAQPREELAALLWPDADTAEARGALRRTLSALKGALGEQAVEADRRTILLRSGSIHVDVVRFSQTLERVREHGHRVSAECDACGPLLLDAISIYRADFLSGFSLRDAPEFDDWQAAQSAVYRRQLGDALEGASFTLAAAGRFDQATGFARRLEKLDPLNEAAHRLLMHIYSLSGDRPAAMRQYQECVRILEQELGVVPVEETTSMYQSIKDGAPAGRAAQPKPELRSIFKRLPLVGRSTEWQSLVSAFDRANEGAQVVALEGEAGIGKTRLLEELLEYGRSGGAVTLASRCYEGESGLAYAPLMQLLRAAVDGLRRGTGLEKITPRDLGEVARLLPQLDAPGPPFGPAPMAETDRTAAHTRFLDAVTRVLLAAGSDRVLLVALDDLQWADPSSLEWLAYLIRRFEGHRVGIVLAWRDDDATQLEAVRHIISGPRRAHMLTEIRLERLDRESVVELVETVSPRPARSADRIPPDLGKWLYGESEGLPLLLGEYLAALTDGTLSDSLPSGVRDLLASRIGAVSETAGQFLTTAAVIGRSFDFQTLRAGSGRDEEMTISALEELRARGLVRELPGDPAAGPAYDFSHDKLRALVYDRTSLARRRLLHRRVAAALGSGSAGRDDSRAGQIAHHYREAGMMDEAAGFYRRAGEHALRLFAPREALVHFETALSLGHLDSRLLHESLGDVHLLLGGYAPAVARYQEASALAAGPDRASIQRKLGAAYDRWGMVDRAESHYAKALEILGEDDPGELARVYSGWSMAAYHGGDIDRSLALARTAYELAAAEGDVRALAVAHNMLGILEGSRNHLDVAGEHLEASLVAAAQISDSGARLAALQNLALLHSRRGDVAAARHLTAEALALSGSFGDRHREAALHNAMADLLHAAGEGEQAMQHLKKAVAIYAEIGVEAGEVRPEVWKLTEW